MADPSNAAIADALEELADLYELDGAIVHRVRAYRTAAATVRDTDVSVAALARSGRAIELKGIGQTLQEKILTLAETGAIPAAERLRAQFPQAARPSGTGARSRPRLLLPTALELGEALAVGLREHGPRDAVVAVAGSTRRGAESVGDIDLVAATSRPGALIESLQTLEQVEAASVSGLAQARGRTHSGVGVDLYVGSPDQFGNLLQHYTGSPAHNEALAVRAAARGLTLGPREVRVEADGTTLCLAQESERLYALLDLAYVEPELREGHGELERLPTLIELGNIRGDLHCHTVASDGRATIAEMSAAAGALGYEYLAITDHSASHGFGNDVSPSRLREQIERISELDSELPGPRLLAGSEVNILPDGSLDYDDELLARLDWVVASVHTSFRMSEQRMTERIIAAIEHPLVDAIGHPTGRLISRREPYAVDLEAVVSAAARAGTLLEINGNPDRRDLPEMAARAAAGAGAGIVIDSDAHRPETLGNMRWGVLNARRAGLGPADVANTRPWTELKRLRKRARTQPTPPTS